ncbi:MAG: EAL domain-containing protein [Bacilli bacterium]|nr:EAL domain-containing protein [Bacilli bacterium]
MMNKKEVSIRQSLLQTVIIPVSILSFDLILSIIMAICYVSTGLSVFYILYFVFTGVLAIAYVIVSIYLYRRLYFSQYNSLFTITRKNYDSFLSGSYKFYKYPKTGVNEIDDLNDKIDVLQSKFDCAYIITTKPDYSNLKLQYVDRDLNIVTFESFEKELPNIIMLSQSYRNVLVDVSFSVDLLTLNENDKKYLVKVFTDLFGDYTGVLFAYREKINSLLIYLPVIDSLSRVEEQIISVIRDSSLTIRDFEGLRYISAKYAIVAYPYSDVDELLSDLRYAKRQGKVVNFYMPKRIKKNAGKSLMLSDAMNVNYMSSLLDQLDELTYDYGQKAKDQKMIADLFTDLGNYLDIDDIGIIFHNDELGIYTQLLSNQSSKLFKGKAVDGNFVRSLAQATDFDSSYFFSKRLHASIYIGRDLDLYGISSGFYYVYRGIENNIDAVIYFFNRNNKDLILDSYIRESLFIICLRVKHYFELTKKNKSIEEYRNENEYLMSLTDYSLYKVDDKSYELKYFSKDLKTVFPSLKEGELCYKALFGLEKPCSDCPMHTFKKKEFTHRKANYEASLTLNEHKSRIRSVLVERLTQGDLNGDLFDKDLLINSYLALYQNIRNSYYVNGRGYVLLLAIDNIETLLEKQGSEGTLFAIRSFLRNLKDELGTDELYAYNNECIALLLHNVGHVDVINTCEKIYELSKKQLLDDGTNEDILKLTYLPLRWPSGYANAEDFMKHVNDFYHHGEHERGKDFIYFYDHKISRSASKREFIISVIEQEFSGSFSSVNLQPIVKAKDKKIFGAEILLRINNVYSNAMFNAEEISRIAEQEGKTNLITEAIINFIGNMYKEYGNSVFKINNLERIAINVDSTYLKDLNLLQGVVKLNDTYKFPNNFLSFEIPEEIIPSHIDEIQKMSQQLSSAHIMFSVDRYTGRYIGVEKLKELGFKEVKIARDLIYKVDTDGTRFNAVKDIVFNAKEVGIGVSVVGVENSAQFTILRDFDENMMMQGYHFYKPLSRADFISALISHNR